MKTWRTTAAVALVSVFSAGAALAALAPRAPTAATGSVSALCAKETNKALIFPLVQCGGFQNATNTAVGNGFPWENSTFFFATFRNQYLYDSAALAEARKTTCTIESIHARSVSFTGGSTNIYGSFANGNASTINVEPGLGSLVSTFALNGGGAPLCSLVGTDAAPINISTTTGPNGSTLSTCASCDPALGDMWCDLGDIDGLPNGGILIDMTLSVGVGNSGAGVWDTDSAAFGGGCTPAGSRAFGSGSFANPGQHLTTALAVDQFDFVWVFKGRAPPPPATVEQQIKEIVRLLLTPEGLRCSGLDLTPGNDRIEDDPIAYPRGASVDPIQPQIGSSVGCSVDPREFPMSPLECIMTPPRSCEQLDIDSTPPMVVRRRLYRVCCCELTGDELVDDARDCGFRCP